MIKQNQGRIPIDIEMRLDPPFFAVALEQDPIVDPARRVALDDLVDGFDPLVETDIVASDADYLNVVRIACLQFDQTWDLLQARWTVGSPEVEYDQSLIR